MWKYEVRVDPETGRRRVRKVKDQHPEADSLVSSIRRVEERKRGRVAAVLAWMIGRRIEALDRTERLKIAGVVLFFAFTLLLPVVILLCLVLRRQLFEG